MKAPATGDGVSRRSSLAISGECTTTLHIGSNISIWYENITREILGWVAKKPSVPPSQKKGFDISPVPFGGEA
ncbi:hypothetical protein PRIPAC_97333 [Pristionchus pacificus]|uniref:Uncharacterized protein n=1 Tax=Pristionchus pacificus TaxID=54126 RepID=A0A2A6CV03_PRIPA|nr:hypothetical protein PRIPAC_97333 [Pristionchus pacificus]|eukprot:PDM81873.1 hypothetical protein PRIPAC_34027 [Pristionchus pacificus]